LGPNKNGKVKERVLSDFLLELLPPRSWQGRAGRQPDMRFQSNLDRVQNTQKQSAGDANIDRATEIWTSGVGETEPRHPRHGDAGDAERAAARVNRTGGNRSGLPAPIQNSNLNLKKIKISKSVYRSQFKIQI